MNLSEGVEASLKSEVRSSVAVPQVQGGPGEAPEPQSEAARARRLRRERAFEVASAVALAVVAVATAWSGYQATRWTDAQSARYAQASAQRVEATREATLAGQLRLYDLVLVNNWLNAHASGDHSGRLCTCSWSGRDRRPQRGRRDRRRRSGWGG
jgi:hypothetical protein